MVVLKSINKIEQYTKEKTMNTFTPEITPPHYDGGYKTKQRVRNRAHGVGDEYIDTTPIRKEYKHVYTYKTFTPMFIFVIVTMAIF